MDLTHFLYAILTGMLPAILWLWFWLREDHLHPEPRAMIAGAFMIGMAAVVVVIPLQKLALSFTTGVDSQYIVWATIEEIVKFIVAYFITFHSIDMDEPLDPIIYLITVSLGFAALENTFFLLGSFSQGDIVQSITTGNMRFVGATLVHVISSACIGLMLGLTFYRRKYVRVLAGLVGLILGISLHSFFNLSIISASTGDTIKIFGYIWISAIVLMMFFEEVKAVKPKIAK
jgi:RsiW-degrading membrane proteinase PrsW (M82 family)